MDTSFKNYMKVGIILHMAYRGFSHGNGPIIETLSKIAVDDYFDAVEITHIENDNIRAQVRNILDIAKLDVAYGGQSLLLENNLNLNSLNEKERKNAVDILKHGIDEAYEINAKGFSFLAGHYEAHNLDLYFEKLLLSTEELCTYAKTKGNMPILCEVFDYDIDKKSLIGPINLVKKYAEKISDKFDNFGLLVDCSHIPMLHETFEENILPIKQFIKHAHMGNTVIKPGYPCYGDLHPRFGFPNSENDVKQLAEYLQLLLDIGFLNRDNRPIVSFEVKPFDNEDSELVIANAKRTLEQAWRLVNK